MHVDGIEQWLYPIPVPADSRPGEVDTPAQIERPLLYPLDWLEERSGLVGGIKYFLFRNVPRDINWMQTLGSATLTAFLVQAGHGRDPRHVLQAGSRTRRTMSIQNITNELTLGWLVRGMHKWGASVFIILMFLHMARVFLFGAYKYPRELNWIVGVLLLLLGMLEGFTGYLLPWDQTAYWATVVGINLNATAPFVGPFLAQFLQGGPSIGPDTLSKFYALHMLLIPGAIMALIGLHLYLVVRLGVTSPPWSNDAGRPRARRGGARRAAARASSDRRRATGSSGRWLPAARAAPARSSSATRRTSSARASRSSPTRCSTTRSCRSSSSA